MRSALGRPGERIDWLVLELAWSELRVWWGRGFRFPSRPRLRPGLPRPSGCGGRILVFCKTAAGDNIFGSELLRLVLEFGGNNERGRQFNVLFPNIEIDEEERMMRWIF